MKNNTKKIIFFSASLFFLLLLAAPQMVLSKTQPPKATQLEDDSKRKGINLYEQKRYAEALGKFREAYKLNPKDSIILHYTSASHIGLRNYTEALNSAKKSLFINPKSDYGYMYLGEAYRGLKMYSEAIDAFNKSDGINHFMGNVLNLGFCYYAIENFAEAKKAFQKATDETPTIQALMGLGRSNYSLGYYKESIENLKAALLLSKASSMNKVIRREMGYAFEALGDHKNADTYFDGEKLIGLEVEKDKDGLKVISSKKGLPAKLAGIENGDILIFFNEIDLYEIDKFSFNKLFNEAKDGEDINIKLLRKGMVLKIIIKKPAL
jgi:tetratricopeptide (TPR) repeat protein